MELHARQSPAHREAALAALVVGGLVVSIVAGAFLIDAPKDGLPGVALGSQTILVVEQIAILFAAWLLAVVVVARALVGELPIEISGRGVRYADAATAQAGLAGSERAFDRVDEEIRVLQAAIAAFETGGGRTPESP